MSNKTISPSITILAEELVQKDKYLLIQDDALPML